MADQQTSRHDAALVEAIAQRLSLADNLDPDEKVLSATTQRPVLPRWFVEYSREAERFLDAAAAADLVVGPRELFDHAKALAEHRRKHEARVEEARQEIHRGARPAGKRFKLRVTRKRPTRLQACAGRACGTRSSRSPS
jgi:hypothetical protein